MTVGPVTPDADTAARLAALDRAIFEGEQPLWTAGAFLNLNVPDHALIFADHAVERAYVAVAFAAGEAEVLNLGVRADARRRGLATALLEAAEDRLSTIGVHRLTLEVREDNAPARHLYDARGFRPVGLRPRYYAMPDGTRRDALILAKALTPAAA